MIKILRPKQVHMYYIALASLQIYRNYGFKHSILDTHMKRFRTVQSFPSKEECPGESKFLTDERIACIPIIKSVIAICTIIELEAHRSQQNILFSVTMF